MNDDKFHYAMRKAQAMIVFVSLRSMKPMMFDSSKKEFEDQCYEKKND